MKRRLPLTLAIAHASTFKFQTPCFRFFIRLFVWQCGPPLLFPHLCLSASFVFLEKRGHGRKEERNTLYSVYSSTFLSPFDAMPPSSSSRSSSSSTRRPLLFLLPPCLSLLLFLSINSSPSLFDFPSDIFYEYFFLLSSFSFLFPLGLFLSRLMDPPASRIR